MSDGSKDDASDDRFGRAIRVGLTLCEIMLAAMALLMFVGVVSRSFFGADIMISEEGSSYLLAAITFLAFPVAFYEGTPVRVDIIYRKLSPLWRRRFDVVFYSLTLVFAAVLEWRFVLHVASSYRNKVRAPTLLATPLYLPQIVMIVGMALLILVLCYRLYQMRFTRHDVSRREPDRH